MTEEQLIKQMADAMMNEDPTVMHLFNSDEVADLARVALAVVRKHDAEAISKALQRSEAFTKEREHKIDPIREALEPVLHWYQSDEHPDRSTADIVQNLVSDAQLDRVAVIAAQRMVQRRIDDCKSGRLMGGHIFARDVLDVLLRGANPSKTKTEGEG